MVTCTMGRRSTENWLKWRNGKPFMEEYCDTSGRGCKNLLFDSFCKGENWHYVK